jgi:hypothetical protein
VKNTVSKSAFQMQLAPLRRGSGRRRRIEEEETKKSDKKVKSAVKRKGGIRSMIYQE